ncbi:MAG2-interacting protein 2 isoform X1 [Ricinus communis]|uniref:MAG2-interacting protein 2 isoform X1 n=1 Tax=Ricinus communis TaxID=3988 RepID=UPI00201AE220|nr:MAG2-interacting protein 2 isoform X1 [Ricinus communis]
MEEEIGVEVFYETRTHASRPYISNYPPQSPKSNEGGKGILSSLFSAPGICQIKKWREYRSPVKIKKPISLIISPSGERVAVATGSQITILRKEDDYQEPCGTFMSLLGMLSFGVWSESHDILGIADNNDTLYFIKVNGEEITRVTKRQLRVAFPIICMIPQDNTDAHESCLCSFIILTADGFLHHIEISQQPTPSISIRQTLNNVLTIRRQFPKDVYCFDYDPAHSLLLVVGSAVSTSIASSGNSGSCQLSLWRRCPNVDLELLSSVQFEGLYHKSKDFLGQIAYPKVLMSPEGNFVATLDISGCLYIFKLDKEQSSLSSIAVGGRFGSQVIDNLTNRHKEFLNDNIDFTWWSDHIVTLARRGGVFTMLNILAGLQLQKSDHIYSMPVLDRVQKLQGHLFLVESKSFEEGKSLYNHNGESTGVHLLEQVKEGTSNQHDFSKLRWRLVSISQRSVSEMYDVLISNHKYQAALDFANQHGLDRDEVLKSQWSHSCQGVNDINLFLSNIKDHGYVLSECVHKVGPTEDAMKALLAYGLHATDQHRFSVAEDHQRSEIWDLRLARLQLLQYRDRLETYLGINMGRFSMQEYSKFRVMALSEAAVTLAESGKIGALNLLFKRHPYSLSPSMLQILAAVPETVPVQTYGQLLPGRSPPTAVSLREEDWVECKEMLSFINRLPENHELGSQIRTEPIVKMCTGYIWPSPNELSLWYMNRARDIDCYSGQLDNCLCLVDLACQKGIFELQQFHKDISYLHQLIYSDESDREVGVNICLSEWEQLSDYEKFRVMLKEVKEENVVKKLCNKAIPFMHDRFHPSASVSQNQAKDGRLSLHYKDEAFLVRWLKEIALENKLDICLMVIEEGCTNLASNGFFKDEIEAVDCGLQCVYLCTITDRWSTLAAILSKLPRKQVDLTDAEMYTNGLEERLKVAEGHIEAGRLLAFYQVPKPMNFFLEAHADEKGIKQILRLMLSKFVRRQPGRSDNDWASMWRDMQNLRDKAFPFLDPEYMLTEFCRGLLKAGRFSLARNYLKGTSSVALASEKAENLVIQAAREFFFSASSLSCSEIWKAKECLNLFPSSRLVKAEADTIEVLTVKLPSLGVTLLPLQFRQIKDPMEIVKMAIISQTGAYLHVDKLIEVAKLLGLNSPEDIAAVEEAVAREAAVAGDLQLAFDLCLVLAKKGHGLIWDLCAAIARGPALENMDVSARKQLLGFALSHCDAESIGELLHAWKDLDMQGQCDTLLMSTGMSSPKVPAQDSSIMSLSVHGIQDIVDLKDCSKLVDGESVHDHEAYISKVKSILSFVAKNLPMQNGTDLESFLRENGKIFSFAVFQLPWLLDLSGKSGNDKRLVSDFVSGRQFWSIRTQALVTILSWLARNGFAPKDDVIASLAKSIIEPPVTEEEDIMGCCFLLNLVDAFSGVEVIEEQLRIRKNYQEICSIMTVGMIYSLLHNFEVECNDPSQRRELLFGKFKEKHTPFSSDEINKIDEVQLTFWRQWKLKLEEKRRVAEHSRLLEQIIPAVETGRFLSGDRKYIESVVFSLIDSIKMEKKRIVKDVLKLADTYGLNHTEVLQRYLSSILVSEFWTDDDIMMEIAEVKADIIDCALETIETISVVVYPAIDGHNKQRLAYIYGLLSDCYLQLEETKQSLIHPCSSNLSTLDLARLYKVFEQECQRVSFIKDLNFKNVAALDGLNLQSLRSEVYAHINELNLEALAKMLQTLAGIYTDSLPENLVLWQDVYKHYVLSLLKTLENRTTMEFNFVNPETFQEFIIQLEHTYDFSHMYIRLLAPSDALEIIKRYITMIVPLHGSYGSIPDNSTWQDCLIILLNFWLRLTEEMQEIASGECLDKVGFDPECLSSCLKVLMRLVLEDSVTPSQSWGSIVGYAICGLNGNFSVEILIFCKAMAFSGCGFGAISELFLEAISQCDISSTPSADSESQDLLHLYINMLEPILKDLVSGTCEHQNLYHLLSSLSKLEGQLDDLQSVRQAVWERMAQFSDNSQLPSHVRVYVLELMQLIRGRNIKGFSTELQSKVLPWEGWDELLSTSIKSEINANHLLLHHTDASSQLTSTLVALKSSQLVAAISPSIEITPDNLLNVETAVSCFLKLCDVSNSDTHVEVLLAIVEEWEGFFVVGRDEIKPSETTEAVNDWNNDDWDEGWESFQEVDSLEKEKIENSLSIDPLHVCWMEIFKKLIAISRFNDVLRLIDHSLTKSNRILLDEDGAKTLSEVLLEMDCFVALKLVLLLPYEALQFQCLAVVEDKFKQGGISETVGRDHEFFILVLSSKIISVIITKSSYGTIFSFLCYLAGNLSRQCQESQLFRIMEKEKTESVDTEKDFLFLFRRILFPSFISELVKADQHILAGFLVTKFMHTNASLSLVNVAEASLARYLERQLHALQHDEFAVDDISSCKLLKNTVSKLRGKLGTGIQSALALLPANVR